MSTWQERVDLQTDPQVLLEHVVRYRFARPLVERSSAWVDLGCGTGLAAAAALAEHLPGRVLLVDRDVSALRAAEQRLGGTGTATAAIDLAADDGVDVLDEHVRALPRDDGVCVTCFETIEHLADFGPLVGWLAALAADRASVILSVPNDAFWSLRNPFHRTTWGDGAFEELRRLLPADVLVARQLPLHGSVLQPLGGDVEATRRLDVRIRSAAVPTHFVVAFGAGAAGLEPVARTEQLELAERRAWERQRDADLAWLRQRVQDLEYETRKLRDEAVPRRAAANSLETTEGAE